MTFVRVPHPTPRSRFLPRRSAASLRYTRTRTSRTARRRELWGNLLSLALIFSSLAFTACTIMGGH